ncbi:hypothetical protein [Streptosporangium pseudovulgare]|uniref:Uncharacterized protein n=1 Tax=Streptosporangium pseudovulgare TaxID=35765 RepID=A0ABQ2REK2_9ACTN|nr:hypothetical protein [Streptosporangium pseudovulgare]GGQ22695.1 hypothetical protein GCM10010140_61300 [Streptosporangium pseudovulgare]
MCSGEIRHRQTVLDDIERVPEALLGLLHSAAPTIGKAIVRLREHA